MIRSLAAASLLAAPAVAEAQQQQCIPPQQIGNAAVVAAPFLIDGVIGACKAHVPAGAFLNSGAPAFSARLRSEGAARVGSAVSVLKLLGGKDIPPIEDPAALLTVIGALAQAMIAPQIPPESCAGLSGVIEALAPLPTDNIALLGSSAATAIAAVEEKKAAKQAAEAAKDGETKAEPAKKPNAPRICPNG